MAVTHMGTGSNRPPHFGSRESWRPSGASLAAHPVLFTLPALIVLATFLLWPLIWTSGMSFTTWNGYGRITWAGLSTWKSLLSDATFQAAIKNTILWMALSATVPVALGFGLAVIFSRSGAILGALGRALAVVPLLLPPAVAAVTWGIIYNPSYGPLNAMLGSLRLPQPDWLGDPKLAFWSLFVIALWSSVGLSVLVFTAALRSIDQAYFDLARVEGAGFWQELLAISIPACRRSAAVAVIVTVVLTSQVFDLLFLLTSAGNGAVMIPLDMYNRAFGGGNVSQGVAEAAVQVGLGVVLGVIALVVSGRHSGMSGEAEYGEPRTAKPAALLTGLACALLILPLGWDMVAAFTRGRAAVVQPLTITWPPDIASFGTAWTSGIGTGLWQSAVIGVIVVAVTLVLSLPAAFGLASRRTNYVVRAAVLTILVVTLLQPGEAYLIPLFYLLQQLNLGDSIGGVVLAEVARELPFAILLLWISIRALPSDVLSAAELDAGEGLRNLRRIIFPLVAPVTAAVGLWVFVTSWSEYTLPTVLLSNSSVQTAPMALRAFAGVHDTEFNLLAAGTLLLVGPVVLLLAAAYGQAGRGLRAAGRAVAG